jgi:3' exoribonuclease, RNase T-like
MRVFYDTEFLEDGKTIRPISIGMVRDDGSEYYAISQDVTRGQLNRAIRRNPWLMENVVPALPQPHGQWILDMPKRWLFNYADHAVKPRHVIAREVRDFILGTDLMGAIPYVELWADYAAYDHVLLCQLWGRMIDLPEGIPMWTHDLRQEIERRGAAKQVPWLAGQEHNALHDAREVKYRYEWLAAQSGTETGLDRVRAAVRRSRGGDAPVQPQGFG